MSHPAWSLDKSLNVEDSIGVKEALPIARIRASHASKSEDSCTVIPRSAKPTRQVLNSFITSRFDT